MADTAGAQKTFELADEQATERCAAALADNLQPGLLIYLSGNLGVGKTSFVRALLRALGHEGAVKSPTYTIVEPYTLAGYAINHFDLYRISDVDELELLGFRDYFDGQAINFVEWPQRASAYLPPSDLQIDLSFKSGSNSSRSLACTAHSETGAGVLHNWNFCS